jgi:hypothetical protein
MDIGMTLVTAFVVLGRTDVVRGYDISRIPITAIIPIIPIISIISIMINDE